MKFSPYILQISETLNFGFETAQHTKDSESSVQPSSNKRSGQPETNIFHQLWNKIRKSAKNSNKRVRRPSIPFRLGGRIGKVYLNIWSILLF